MTQQQYTHIYYTTRGKANTMRKAKLITVSDIAIEAHTPGPLNRGAHNLYHGKFSTAIRKNRAARRAESKARRRTEK